MAKRVCDFPQTIYVCREQDGKDSFLVTYESVDDIPEDRVGADVAEYTRKPPVHHLRIKKELV